MSSTSASLDSSVNVTTLDSGVTVVTERMPGALSVTSAIWVGIGSRDEAPEQAGCSHFLEHLLFKGTASRTPLDIAQAIDAVGGEMNAYTTKEYTTFYTRTVAEDAALSLDILCDIISRPALRDEDVDAERQVILEEIAMRSDEPADLVHDIIHERSVHGWKTAVSAYQKLRLSPAEVINYAESQGLTLTHRSVHRGMIFLALTLQNETTQ